MSLTWFDWRIDILLTSALLLLSAGVLHARLRREGAGLPRVVWLGLCAFLLAAVAIADVAGDRERDRVRLMLSGMSPTYAAELSRLGHHTLDDLPAADDPTYLRLIETQKRWLAVNPLISDIYTIRRDADGSFVLLVDSETDYNDDGIYSGGRESRTTPGTPFDDNEHSLLTSAFAGQTVFDDRPFTDPWGTWVSSYSPIHAPDGSVEAVLGVDYDARLMVSHIAQGRLSVLAMVLTVAGVYLAGAAVVISGRNHARRLVEAALHDPLTRLPNRRLLVERLNLALQRMKRDAEAGFAVLFLDFDRFKVINDSMGHEWGDRLLAGIAGRLQGLLRGTDLVTRSQPEHEGNPTQLAARLGGDEFVVLLENVRGPHGPAAVARRVHEMLKKPFRLHGRDVQIQASIGIVIAHPRYGSADELLRDADIAMYRAKAEGTGRYAIFDQAMHAQAVERLHDEIDLRQANQRKQIRMVYQPIVSLETRRVVGFEALMRWNRDGREIPPTQFIPLAEETGLITELGEWALVESCQAAVRWNQARGEPAYVAVNLSRKQLGDPALVDHLRRALDSSGLPAELLRLELTESTIMTDPQAATTVLTRLKSMGVTILLDDFGTGHSSLSCIHNFPIDGVKLDRGFIAASGQSRECAAIVNAIIMLARDLNMKVIAEGVETPAHVALLQALGCQYAQGYYFARPLEEHMVCDALRALPKAA